MLTKTMKTGASVLRDQGARRFAEVSVEKAAMWWRHGRPLELGKFVGRPTEIAMLDGCAFELDTMPDNVRYLLLSGKHEKPERTLLNRHLDPRLPLVEIGGAVGVVSCIANRRLRQPNDHVVVEANPALVPILSRNRDRNRCRFTVVNGAIAYERATVPFHVDQNILASSVANGGEQTVDVPAVTLREILEQRSFGRCSVVCDIEGAEVDLVEHEWETLSQRVSLLIMELHERMVGAEPTRRLLRTLADAGFRVRERIWDSYAFCNDATALGR